MLISSFFLVACPSAPKAPFDYRHVQAGKWRAKVEIDIKGKSKDHTLTINFKSIKAEKKVRADISAILGIHLASVVVDGNSYQALLIKKKIYREGRGNHQLIPKEVFGVAIDLRILPAVLYDESINAVGWVCHSDGKGFLQDCDNATERTRLEVTGRDGVNKSVKLLGDGYSINFKFDNFSPDERFTEKTFNLPIPKGFKRI
ncbi:MAG: hypothetical protein A4S09_05740 [Proteobacteria bacterium SG_bin7]|nr:MAG: hypothetical protein A4S09_05740 [Proteobacteria bacterium SG_bin7]